MFVFDGGSVDAELIAAIVLPADELSGFEFVPPSRLTEYLPDYMARRITAAIAARGSGPTELPDGEREGRPVRAATAGNSVASRLRIASVWRLSHGTPFTLRSCANLPQVLDSIPSTTT